MYASMAVSPTVVASRYSGLALALSCVLLFAMASAWDQSVARTGWIATAAGLLVLMAALDLRHRRVPNTLVYSSLAAALLVSALAGRDELLLALQGGAIAFGLMLVLAFISRGSMGMADVKVGTLCGLLLGPQLVIPAIAIMAIGAAGVALLLVLTRHAGIRSELPLVPFMAAATLIFLVNGSAAL